MLLSLRLKGRLGKRELILNLKSKACELVVHLPETGSTKRMEEKQSTLRMVEASARIFFAACPVLSQGGLLACFQPSPSLLLAISWLSL